MRSSVLFGLSLEIQVLGLVQFLILAGVEQNIETPGIAGTFDRIEATVGNIEDLCFGDRFQEVDPAPPVIVLSAVLT